MPIARVSEVTLRRDAASVMPSSRASAARLWTTAT